MNLREEADNHTFIIWKPSEGKEEENYVSIRWGSSMTLGIVGNPPTENAIDKIGLGISSSTKQ